MGLSLLNIRLFFNPPRRLSAIITLWVKKLISWRGYKWLNFTLSTREASHFQLGVTKDNVEKLVTFADRAIDNKGTWQGVTFKMPNGNTKKFQVKFQTDEEGNKTASTRRNSKLATFSRFPLIKTFLGWMKTPDTKAFDKAAGDVIKRYTVSRHSIRNNPDRKEAHEHLLTTEQLAKAAKPFKTEGYIHI